MVALTLTARQGGYCLLRAVDVRVGVDWIKLDLRQHNATSAALASLAPVPYVLM